MFAPLRLNYGLIAKCPVESSFVLAEVGFVSFITELFKKTRFDVKFTDFLKNFALLQYSIYSLG